MFSQEQIDQEEAGYIQDVQLAEALARLESNPDFTLVFGEQFIEAFAITNTMLIADYDVPTRTRTVEKMIARSHFVQFINMTKQDGLQAAESLSQMRADREAGIDEDETNGD